MRGLRKEREGSEESECERWRGGNHEDALSVLLSPFLVLTICLRTTVLAILAAAHRFY